MKTVPSHALRHTIILASLTSPTHARTLHSKPKDSGQRSKGSRTSVVKGNLSRQQRYTLDVLDITLIKKI